MKSWVLKIKGQYVIGWHGPEVGAWDPLLGPDRGRAWRFYYLSNARMVRDHIPRTRIFRLERRRAK
jgi:hypothetical protein